MSILNVLEKKSSNKQEMEQAFFSLAYNELQSKIGNILPYLIGFEIVESNDDGSKQLGVFGFKSVGRSVLLVPVFFINGEIRGMDFIYHKENDQYYPLSEDMANVFLKEDMSSFGSKANTTADKMREHMSRIDVGGLGILPQTGRHAYASHHGNEPEVDLYAEALKMFTVDKLASAKFDVNLIDWVKQAGCQKDFVHFLKQEPAFLEAVARHYSQDKIASVIADTISVSDDKPFPKNDVGCKGVLFVAKPGLDWAEAAKQLGLTIQEKEQAVKKGYYLLDKRAESEKSVVYSTDLDFTNPTKNGVYRYVTKTGDTVFGLIFPHLKSLKFQRIYPSSVVIPTDPKANGIGYCVPKGTVFVRGEIQVPDKKEINNMLMSLSEVEPGYNRRYMLVDENWNASQPFTVKANYKDSDGVRKLEINLKSDFNELNNRSVKTEDYTTATAGERLIPSAGCDYSQCNTNCITLVESKHLTGDLVVEQDRVLVPKRYRVLEYKTPEYYFPQPEDKKKESEPEFNFAPGDIRNLNTAIENASLVRLHGSKTGSANLDFYDFVVGDKRYKFKCAKDLKVAAIADWGLGEKSAEDLISSLKNKKVAGFLKKGLNFAPETGQTSYGQQYNVPTSRSQVVGPTGSRPENSNVPGYGVHEPGSGAAEVLKQIQVASELASRGQKNIFDIATIGTLAKTTNPTNKIITTVPKIVEAMDHIGRILFMTYWRTNEFEKLFGASDLPDLVELTRTTFKNLGDTVLFLKRRLPEVSVNSGDYDRLSV